MLIAPEQRSSAQYVRYRRFVGHALRRVGVAEADVDDLSQEVFMVLLRRVHTLHETDRLMGWLQQVVRRVASNHRRGLLRRHERQRGWPDVAAAEDPERALARAEAAGFLADFFEGLDDEARPVFLLSEVEGLAGPQIAEQLGLNLNTTYSRIRAVRRRFHAAVDEQRASSPAWMLALPSLLGPSGWGPVGWMLGALRTTATQKLVAGLTVLLVALGLAMLTRGSCSAGPEGGAGASPVVGAHDREGSLHPPGPGESEGLAAMGGGATILGRVEDLGGAGVAKASVCMARGAAAPPHCVATDDDGRYAITGALGGSVMLVASARGYVAAPAYEGQAFRRIRVPMKGTLHDVDLLLRAGGREVSGHVRDVVGGPIEGAVVTALEASATIAASRTRSDEDGRFTLWVDVTSFVRVEASAEGYVPAQVVGFLPAGEAFALVLSPEAVIEGRVVDAQTGEGLADVLVDVQRSRFETPRTARSDASGRFRLVGLEPGRYKPRVADAAWLGYARDGVALELGETVGGVLIEAHGARQLEGRVQRPGGEPCVDGQVTLRDASGEDVRTQRVDDEGQVRVGGLLPGEYTVVAACEHGFAAGGVETAIELFDADVEGAVWDVPEERYGERALRGRVVGPAGEPVPFARVEAVRDERLEDGTMVGPIARAGRDGRFAIEHVPAGEYRVYVEAEGFAPHDSVVVIAERDVEVKLELEAAAGVRIHALDARGVAVAGVKIVVASTFDLSGTWVTTNATGWAEVPSLQPGAYELVVSRPGVGGRAGAEDPSRSAGGTPITLADGATTEITLTVPSRDGRIRGTALRADGDPVADAVVTVHSSWTFVDYVGEARSATVGEAHTDEEGRFVVEGLEAESFTVTVQDAWGQSASVDHVAPGASVALELPAPGRLSGVVEIEGEDPPEHFTVTVTPAQGRAYGETFLRTKGGWSLVGVPPGAVRVEVSSAWGTASTEASVPAGGDAEPVTLRLAPRGRIRGTVVRSTGEPLAGVHLVVRSEHGPATGTIATTDHQGAFALDDAPSGAVVVKVIAPVGLRSRSIPVDVPSGDTAELGVVRLEAIGEEPASADESPDE